MQFYQYNSDICNEPIDVSHPMKYWSFNKQKAEYLLLRDDYVNKMLDGKIKIELPQLLHKRKNKLTISIDDLIYSSTVEKRESFINNVTTLG